MNSDCCNSLNMSENSNTTPPLSFVVYYALAILLQYICINCVLFWI